MPFPKRTAVVPSRIVLHQRGGFYPQLRQSYAQAYYQKQQDAATIQLRGYRTDTGHLADIEDLTWIFEDADFAALPPHASYVIPEDFYAAFGPLVKHNLTLVLHDRDGGIQYVRAPDTKPAVVVSASIAQFVHVHELSIANSKYYGYAPGLLDAIASLPRLRSLHLALPGYAPLQFHRPMPVLESLSLAGCRALELSGEALRGSTALRDLTIENSDDLEGVPDDWCPALTGLATLQISACSAFYYVPPSLGLLAQLKLLDLNANRISALPDVFHELPALRTLHLGGNLLTALPQSMRFLHPECHIDVSYNQLPCLPGFLYQRMSGTRVLAHGNPMQAAYPHQDCAVVSMHNPTTFMSIIAIALLQDNADARLDLVPAELYQYLHDQRFHRCDGCGEPCGKDGYRAYVQKRLALVYRHGSFYMGVYEFQFDRQVCMRDFLRHLVPASGGSPAP